jgi:hypothetical protein
LGAASVERFEKDRGGVPHTPCRIRVPVHGDWLLGEQNRSSNTQSEMSSIPDASFLRVNFDLDEPILLDPRR